MTGSTRRIKLLTYNIHHGVGRDRRYDLERIAEVLASERADIVTLQEVDHGMGRSAHDDQTCKLADQLGYEALHCVTCQMHGGDFGITIMSRFPLVHNHRYDISHGNGREPRSCQRADVEVAPGELLHVFNCHLGLGTRERRGQRQQMLSEAILLGEDLHHPVVIMGDFNDRPVPVVHRELRRHFQDAYNVARTRRRGPTFYKGPLRLRLDHIYTSPEIRVVECRVCNDSLTRMASDHRPLVATVEIDWAQFQMKSNGTSHKEGTR